MLRKQIIKPEPATPEATTGEIDIATVATVLVTSEAPDHPIDLAFDEHRGSGGTHWTSPHSRSPIMMKTPSPLRASFSLVARERCGIDRAINP